jgi:PAS domain S-box-containing protein
MSSPQPVRILFAEDSEGTARLLQRRLERVGYIVDIASDGPQSLAMYDASSYDVLALDHDMPKMTGLEVIRALASRGPLPPTIMITGAGNEAVAVEAMKLGADDYIIKDPESRYLDLLPSVIEQAISKKRLIEEKRQTDAALQQSHDELENRVRLRTEELLLANERLRASEETLRTAKNRLSRVLESISDGFFALDDALVVTYFNKEAERLLGRKSVEVIGRNLFESFPELKGSIFEEKYAVAAREKIPLSFETYFDVEPYRNWYDVKVYPFEDGISVYFQVTTDRKNMDESLRKSKEAFEAVLTATEDAAFLVDTSGNFLGMNEKTALVFQRRIQELVGKSVFDLVTPRVAARRRALHAEVLRSGRGIKFEDETDGRIFAHSLYPVVGPDSKAARVAWFTRDITEQKLAKEARRESEERFRAIFETARDCIFIKDSAHRYTHANPAMEELLGIPAAKIIGRTDEELFGPELAAHLKGADNRVLMGETIEEERTIMVKDQPVALLNVLSPMRNGRGEIVGICGIARDITGRKPAVSLPMPSENECLSPAMGSALKSARLAAKTDSIILLTGESGSGKDYLARHIHDMSSRSFGPFFSINCAAVPSELAEAELFGHERGAYTGSVGRSRGLLELAEGGTLLLNEIGEFSLALQAKLLTFLDTRSFTRVGGRDPVKVNARLIAATNRDMEKEVSEGRFRADLFYRLNVFSIKVPPLRQRIEDIPVLAKQIISRLCAELQVAVVGRIDPRTMSRLTAYHWPGNVRELKNVLERALILSEGEILEIDSLQPERAQLSSDWTYQVEFPTELSMTDLFRELRRSLIREALRRVDGRKQDAAALLGISRHTLRRHMVDLQLNGAE